MSLVREASLSPEEVKLWEEVVVNIPEELCADLYDVLKSVPGAVRATTDNLKEKKEALQSGDIRRWEEVFNKEDNFLLSLIKE
jgi:hypothetical protein